MEMLRPSGARGVLWQTIGEVRAEEYWKAVPVFGAWAGLAGLDPEVSPSAVLNELPGPDPAAARPPEQRLWRPPVPLQPAEPGVVFRPHARYALPGAGAATVEIHQAVRLHMPHGHLL